MCRLPFIFLWTLWLAVSRVKGFVSLQTASSFRYSSQLWCQPTSDQAELLKQELVTWGTKTKRGFQASRKERQQVRKVIDKLAQLNPTPEPAAAYYTTADSNVTVSLQGKWTLLYTDAPDITSLENPNPLVELGRIGQECNPPTIANVIEWKAPAWTQSNPLVGENARLLQKVVTQGKADPSRPAKVQLDIAGLQIQAPTTSDSSNPLLSLLKSRPVDLRGPWQLPFGEFELLYLDDHFRVTRTGQNYIAVNQRIPSDEEPWF